MKDIARDLGVSVVTISKVLRNHEDIGDETRRRVLARMKECNYRPNLAARGLVTGRSYLIGLVVPDLLHPFFAEIAKALSQALLEEGYYLIIATSDEDAALEAREIDQLLSRRLDALVIASCCPTQNILRQISEQGTLYVLIDRRFAGLAANFVGVDDEQVGVLATKHLIEMGCKRIAHLRGPENSTGLGRLKGYLDTLAKAKMRNPRSYVSTGRAVDVESRESGADAMRQLLTLRARPDGVFCYNDSMAIGAMNTIFEAGLRVPEDIAIIGCGNLHYDPLLRVPLSSIDQQTEQIGKRAASLTLAMLDAKTQVRPKAVVLDPKLIVRESSRRK